MAPDLKVLLMGDYPPPAGGIATHVQQLHGYLRDHGVEVQVLDIGKGGQPASGVLPVRTALRLVAEVSRYAARGWVLHLHTSGGNPKSWALVAAVGTLGRPVGGRSLVTLHSGLIPEYLGQGPVRRAAARCALAGFHSVVAVSTAIEEALVLTAVPRSKVAVFPAFVPSALQPGVFSAALAHVREASSPVLSYAHHPSPVYGRRLMFAALRLAARMHPRIALAAFGPGTQAPEFWRDAKEEGVEERVVALGDLTHPEALAVMRASDAFIRPTLADGDAISVREALALGIPCVASDVAVRPSGVFTFRGGEAEDLVCQLGEALRSTMRPSPLPDAGAWLLARYRELAPGANPGAHERSRTPSVASPGVRWRASR